MTETELNEIVGHHATKHRVFTDTFLRNVVRAAVVEAADCQRERDAKLAESLFHCNGREIALIIRELPEK